MKHSKSEHIDKQTEKGNGLFWVFSLIFLIIVYYVAILGQMLNLFKITDEKITLKALIPFYYLIY